MHSTLEIENLDLQLHLGVSSAEQQQSQRVSFSIKLQFQALSAAVQTDDLDDTWCYQQLEDLLRETLCARSFHLLEHLAYVSFNLIRTLIPAEVDLWLRVTKYLPDGRGSRSFSLCSKKERVWQPL